MSKSVALLVGIVVAAGFWSVAFLDIRPVLHRYHALVRSGVKVTGNVTAKMPMNHASVLYDYYADGTTYSSGPCQLGDDFDRIQVGDPISVTYLPSSPATSACADVQQAYHTIWGIAFIVMPCFTSLAGGLSALTLYRYFNSRGSRNPSTRVMGNDSDYSSAWTDYRHRRRWFFGVWLGGFAVILLFVVLVSDSAIAWLAPVQMIGFLITAVRLSTFRCPRCHHWWRANPLTRKCRHCGLPKWSESDLHEKHLA